ncbi:unnamed protein product [Staurois parvus]|uniref:Uncharacterized protein n=1 Tax=Staurois parvus TaxID=386267 RepID=A0ABN9B677_9NEOB|nr:unnamed protein product [Staurois parvus]
MWEIFFAEVPSFQTSEIFNTGETYFPVLE